MITHSLIKYFYVDSLAVIMMILVSFIGLVVGLYSKRYMQGDAHYQRFLIRIVLLIFSVMLMVSANNIFVMLVAWAVSNFILIKLMVHKPQWQAAKASGWLAAKAVGVGFLCLTLAFLLIYYSTGLTSIQDILHVMDKANPLTTFAMTLVVIAAIAQSGIWPFHRWLISSLNSPTPVSAMMHAGLVNGGGFLIARFSPLYISQPNLLNLIFILGIISAIVGTLWKLMQNDIKRMLACSTVAQMGFMLVQCGLGLFPAAVAHLCWHGLFKANLFLSANSAESDKRLPANSPPSMIEFMLALVCGALSSYLFALCSNKTWLSNDTTIVLEVVAFIAASQLALTLLKNAPWRNILFSVLFTSFMGALYGLSVWSVQYFLSPALTMNAQSINALHIVGLTILMVSWVALLFKDKFTNNCSVEKIWQRLYVKALNASQPHSSTITMHRNQYSYK